MHSPALLIATACLLVAVSLILIPLAPGGHVNARDLSGLPHWQYNLYNSVMLSLGLGGLITAGFAIAGQRGAFVAALIIAVLCLVMFALDIGRVFPAVPHALSPELLVLEIVDLALAGVLVVIAIEGIRTFGH